jgi:hypothetical protein
MRPRAAGNCFDGDAPGSSCSVSGGFVRLRWVRSGRCPRRTGTASRVLGRYTARLKCHKPTITVNMAAGDEGGHWSTAGP